MTHMTLREATTILVADMLMGGLHVNNDVFEAAKKTVTDAAKKRADDYELRCHLDRASGQCCDQAAEPQQTTDDQPPQVRVKGLTDGMVYDRNARLQWGRNTSAFDGAFNELNPKPAANGYSTRNLVKTLRNEGFVEVSSGVWVKP